ncbi:MAG: hypothetical protein GX552_14300 [Chloroflexi bacterium]|jgi:hypothetical protein|nr:hypothetical protein [Chloroflexota bacterium]
MDARILTIDLQLVGVQGIVYESPTHGRGNSLDSEEQALWDKLYARLDTIRYLSRPQRAIGYWHFVDSATRLFFAGAQVNSLEGFQWDYHYGLVSWAPGKVTFAAFPGSTDRESPAFLQAFQQVVRLGYAYDGRFVGEFEVCPLDWVRAGHTPADGAHEIWVPVKRVFDMS